MTVMMRPHVVIQTALTFVNASLLVADVSTCIINDSSFLVIWNIVRFSRLAGKKCLSIGQCCACLVLAAYDECLEGTHDCDPSFGVCTDTAGGFECTCREGFRGDGKNCVDIDECTEQIDDCSDNAECADVDGSFRCTCNPGFQGDGNICTGLFNFLQVILNNPVFTSCNWRTEARHAVKLMN